MTPKVWAVVTAAGASRRMGGVSKMLLELGGLPLVVRTLRVFESSLHFQGVALSVPPDQVEHFTEMCREHGLTKVSWVVPGGRERQDSIRNALQALPAQPHDWVAIHDGARPFLSSSVMESLLACAPEYDGVLPMVAVKDTIKRVDAAGLIVETLKRPELYAAQTPQLFRFGRILEAHCQAAADSFVGTDDCSLIERSGGRIGMVEGDYRNIKVTTPEDLTMAAAWLGEFE